MNEKELWNYFLEKQVCVSKTLRHTLIWVEKKDFDAVRDSFVQDFNLIHAGRSYRSRGYLLHLHCVEQGDHVLAHRDIANITRFFPFGFFAFGIIHLLFDVLPYVILAFIKRVSFRSFFTLPR